MFLNKSIIVLTSIFRNRYKDEYNKITHKIPSPSDLDRSLFGANNRDRYPLVVMLALNDKEIEDQVEINDIVKSKAFGIATNN